MIENLDALYSAGVKPRNGGSACPELDMAKYSIHNLNAMRCLTRQN